MNKVVYIKDGDIVQCGDGCELIWNKKLGRFDLYHISGDVIFVQERLGRGNHYHYAHQDKRGLWYYIENPEEQ